MRMNYLKSQMHKKWEDASAFLQKQQLYGNSQVFSTITQQINLLITFSFTTLPCDECRQQQSKNTVHFLPIVL